VPYQNVVVGLVSNQLLIQCICVLLLRGTRNTVAAEQGIVTDSDAVCRGAANDASSAAGSCHGDDSANLLASIPPLPGLNDLQHCVIRFAYVESRFNSSEIGILFDLHE